MKIALRRRIVFLSFLGLSFLMLGTVTNAYSADLSFGLKLGGGIGYLFNGAGDLEKTRLGFQSYAADWVETNYTSTFNWEKLSILPDFRFEAILKIGESFGVGLGTAYLTFTSKGDYSLDHYHVVNPWWGSYTHQYTDVYSRSYKMTAIPISLNFYYFLPMNGMSMYAFAGPSVYFGSLKHDLTDNFYEQYSDTSWYYWNEAYNYQVDIAGTEESTCTAFGFQGGIGLEIPLSPNFAFAVEAYGRYAGFSNWEGTWSVSAETFYEEYYEPWGWWYSSSGSGSDSGAGFLYYAEWQGWTGDYYGEMWLDNVAPSGSGVRNVAKASLNLNSIGILAHIVIHF